MDMPCVCPLCGEIVELNDMRKNPEIDNSDLICNDCASDLEEEIGEEHICTECGSTCFCDYEPCICCNEDW